MIIHTPKQLAQQRYRAKKKRWAINYLGGKCRRCSTANELEFNHIDPATKSFTIGANLNLNYERLIEELKKCELLCHECHMDVSIKQSGKKRSEHGMPSKYQNHGCRCTPCREAWRLYIARKRLVRKFA